jgi:hypothetical protein
MAIWHFQVRLIPEGALPPIETIEGADASACWRDSISPDWDGITSNLLRKQCSSTDGVDIWGDPDSIQLYVVRTAGQIEDAFVRIDVRVPISPVMDQLLARFRESKLLLAFSNSDIRQSSFPELSDRLEKSTAWRRFKSGD